MDKEKSSEMSEDTDVSSSEVGRTPSGVENISVSLAQNSVTASGDSNVVIGQQKIINTEKADDRASNIKEATRKVLNSVDWRVYVETRAEKRGVALLKKHGVVIVVGCPGSGKTTLALSMMRQIENEENRESYSLTHHREFSDISLSTDKKYVVLIDDIFGKTNLVSEFIDSWKLKFPMIWNLVHNRSLKCIITLRKIIFSETEISLKEFGLFNEKHVLDLQNDDCCLTYNEKKTILNKYLKQNDVKMDETDKNAVIYNSCTELGFPQVCVYYVNSSDAQKRGVDFFKKPIEYLKQQLENLKKDETLQINYLVLLLILFKQCSLSIDSLDPFENGIDSDIMKLIRQLESACLSVRNTSLKRIKKTANVMCGTYLKCCDNKYTFIHQSVFDCLFLMFSSKFPKKAAELLEVCPVSMLLEYIVTPGVSNKSHITMTVTPDCFDVLARRFTDLLASENFIEIISHPSLKDEEFLKYLIKEKNFYGRLSEILNRETSSVTSHCIVNGLKTLSKYFTSNLCKMERTDLKNKLLILSCFFGDEDIVMIMLKSGVVPTYDAFCAAAGSKTDSTIILTELFKNKKKTKLSVISDLLHISICSRNMNIACLLADMINKEEENSEIKRKAVKLLLVRFLIQIKFELNEMHIVQCDLHFEKAKTIKDVDVSRLFKKLVTIDIINKIKDIAIIAAGQRSSNIIKEIVRLKPDCLNDENRDKVLLAAAMWGSTDTVNFLIEQRCNDKWNKSEVLKVAVIFNSVDVVQCLLDKGADLNMNAPVNEKLIQYFEQQIMSPDIPDAFRFIDINIPFKSLEDKPSLKPLPSDSPLHISVLRGNLDMIKSLIGRNADVNAVNSQGETPLHVALKAVTHRKEVALLLLENDADINITDKQKNSVLHIASQIDIDVVEELIEKGAEINVKNTKRQTPLHLSIYNSSPEIAFYLLEHGADRNSTDIYNNTVFHLAAEQGYIEIVTALIEKGFDVNIRNDRGETPLLTAVKHKLNKVVFSLLDSGADPNSADNDNNSVLHLAVENANMEIVTALIEKGVNVNVKNSRGETPLFTALKCKDSNSIFSFCQFDTFLNDEKCKVAVYLLEHGAHPKLTDNDKHSVLHLAAKHGSLEIVTALIEKDADVNIKDSRGETPLVTALTDHGHYSSLESGICRVALYLLEHGADYNITINDKNSVLHIAAKDKYIEIVTALIEKGVDINIKNSQGETPLFTGVKHKQTKVALYLLECGADPNLTDKDNNSVLHVAAEQGDIEIVKELIEKGVDVNVKNTSGETPIFRAVKNEQKKVVFYLLEHGADPNVKDIDGNSLLHVAAGERNIEIVTVLIVKDFDVNITNSRGETPLFRAVTYKENKVVFYLLEHGADPNLRDNDNNSVLHLAAKCGFIDIVTELVDRGVDVNIKNSQGQTPLSVALTYVNIERSTRNRISKVVVYLLQHGADTNVTDSDRNSVFHLAAQHGYIEVVSLLIEKGFDVNIKNIKGETPLFRAVHWEDTQAAWCLTEFDRFNKVAFYLLQHGADPNVTDNDNNTVLHLAARYASTGIVSALIKKGADVNIKNSRGETAILTALSWPILDPSLNCEQWEIILYLLQHGADPNVTDNDRNSVLHLAAKYGKLVIVVTLIEKGFDVNIRNIKGETPLFSALTYDERDKFLNKEKCQVVCYLLQHGADLISASKFCLTRSS